MGGGWGRGELVRLAGPGLRCRGQRPQALKGLPLTNRVGPGGHSICLVCWGELLIW